ncbi:MAG TPA: DUF2267 domain-containing protein [Desulfobacterales bacterium]
MRPGKRDATTEAGTNIEGGESLIFTRHQKYYRFFIRPLRSLEFVADESAADAYAHAVLKFLSCAASEKNARKLVRYLPDPLTIEILRDTETASTSVSHAECVTEISRQFRMSEQNASIVTQTVIRSVKSAVGGIILMEVAESLAEDWAAVIEDA